MELGELIAALGAHVADDEGGTDEEKLKTVIKEMRGHESPQVKAIAQRLLNAGAAHSKTDVDKRIKGLEKDLKEAIAAADELTHQLEAADAAKGKPSEKEAALEKERDRWKLKAEQAGQSLAEERTGRQQDTVEKSRVTFLGALKGRVDDFGIKAVERIYADRFRVKEGGGVEVLDEDGEVIEAPKGKTAEEVLAEHAFATVPDSNRIRNLVPGGGVGRAGQGVVTQEQMLEEKRQTVKAFL